MPLSATWPSRAPLARAISAASQMIRVTRGDKAIRSGEAADIFLQNASAAKIAKKKEPELQGSSFVEKLKKNVGLF